MFNILRYKKNLLSHDFACDKSQSKSSKVCIKNCVYNMKAIQKMQQEVILLLRVFSKKVVNSQMNLLRYTSYIQNDKASTIGYTENI